MGRSKKLSIGYVPRVDLIMSAALVLPSYTEPKIPQFHTRRLSAEIDRTHRAAGASEIGNHDRHGISMTRSNSESGSERRFMWWVT